MTGAAAQPHERVSATYPNKGKDQHLKFEVSSLQNAYGFCTITNLKKSHKSNNHKFMAVCISNQNYIN